MRQARMEAVKAQNTSRNKTKEILKDMQGMIENMDQVRVILLLSNTYNNIIATLWKEGKDDVNAVYETIDGDGKSTFVSIGKVKTDGFKEDRQAWENMLKRDGFQVLLYGFTPNQVLEDLESEVRNG
ncbi:MAG: hypothetical protein ACRC0G_08060 [Fusobacteriaceae bacterium]